jgi:hypothetical protein
MYVYKDKNKQQVQEASCKLIEMCYTNSDVNHEYTLDMFFIIVPYMNKIIIMGTFYRSCQKVEFENTDNST